MVRFLKLKEEHLEMVMRWRTSPEVTRFMITDVEYDLGNQQRWFNKIKEDKTCNYWVIVYGDTPIGLINLAAIDRTNQKCSAGYYIGDSRYRQLGAMIPPYLYNYVFREMKFNKIYGEVLKGNEKILLIYKMHGFTRVGIYHDHIFKNGNFHDVVLIELMSGVWLKQKRYQRYVSEFK